MAGYDDLATIRSELDRCMKCGNCQAVCPLYSELRKEAAAARGKIRLVEALLAGELALGGRLEDRLALCLTCGACSANCPSGVRFDRVILAARTAAVRRRGLSPVKRLVFYGVLRHRRVFRGSLRAGRRLQGLVRRPRFPIGLDRRRVVPALARRTLLEELPPVVRVPEARWRVAYFAGCMNTYVYTGIGRSVVEVLAENRVEVVIPSTQHCCGIPVIVAGDQRLAREMAQSNLGVFAGLQVDALITSCSTCVAAWRHHYPELLPGEAHRTAAALARKTYDISEFLVDVVGLRPPTASLGVSVTYHDPCHLNRIAGVTRQPREILRAIPGVEFRELSDPGRCCGGAGSFSLSHYGLSMRVAAHKVKDIAGTGAAAVATGCPACRMQLEDALTQAGLAHPVRHVVELLAEAYRAERGGDSRGQDQVLTDPLDFLPPGPVRLPGRR